MNYDVDSHMGTLTSILKIQYSAIQNLLTVSPLGFQGGPVARYFINIVIADDETFSRSEEKISRYPRIAEMLQFHNYPLRLKMT